MNTINPLIFRAYDIRGIADSSNSTPDLTEESVYLIGKATGTHLKKNYNAKNIVVGSDNRLTSPILKQAYIKGLLETGLDVTDIGLSTSPMIYWAVCAMNFDAGTNITASHNPKEYNGLKIISKNAHSICGDELQEILKIIQNNNFDSTTTPGKLNGKPTERASNEVKDQAPPVLNRVSLQNNPWPKYLEEINSKVKIKRKLKIAVDCGNGVTGKFATELIKKLGCEIVPLYCELDGNFPNHEANPEESKNMEDLIKKVLETKADLGIGFDGDGDRIGIVDEKGKHYSSDFMLLLLAKDLLTRLPGSKIIFDIKISQVIIEKLKKLGAVPIMSKTGHSFIEARMKELKAPLAGEVSGHLFFAENYYGFDDAFLAAAKIIEIVSNEAHPLSQMFNDLPRTFTTPEFKASCPDDKKFKIVKALVKHFTKIYNCITIDGVRVNFDKNAWGAIRASNTSPNLTLRFEAPTPEKLQKIQKIMITELKKHPEVNTNWYHKALQAKAK